MADVTTLMDGPSPSRQAAQRFVAVVQRSSGGYDLELQQSGADGRLVQRRTLQADDCALLARAAALIVAVSQAPLRVSTHVEDLEQQAQPESPAEVPTVAVVRQPVDVGTPESSSRPTPVGAPVATTNGRAEPARHSRGWSHRFIAGGLVGVAVGAVPGVTAGVGGWAGYAFGPLRLELGGGHAFGRRRDLQPGIAIDARRSGGSARVVFAPRLGPVVGLVGVGVAAGTLVGGASGDRVRRIDVSDWWLAVPITAGLAWPAQSRIALRGQASVSVLLRRPGIGIRSETDDIEGFRHPPVDLAVTVGPEIRLP